MRKVCIVLTIVFMFIALPVFAQLRETSGAITSDTLLLTVTNNPVGLCGVFMVANGTNAATVTIYDNTSAAGKKLREFTVAAGEYYGGFVFPYCIRASTGIYVDVGTNTTVYVDYVK